MGIIFGNRFSIQEISICLKGRRVDLLIYRSGDFLAPLNSRSCIFIDQSLMLSQHSNKVTGV